MAKNTVRTSFSLPKELNDELGEVSKLLGITKSAIASQLLSEGVGAILAISKALPADRSPRSLKRFRGKSEALIEEKLRQFRRGQDDLFRDT